ncbi:MAG: hypothetical protein EON53_03285 [Actinomycetales bacterium]|nr:MAG: hypothetical protein EON53_03285 [Actinomycetales bacterium]
MRAATELRTPARFITDEDALPAQLPLPLPGSPSSVVPVPRTRDGEELARQLRAPIARFMQGLTEVLCGGRPARQLSAWMTPDAHAALVTALADERSGRPRRRDERAVGGRLASVHLSVVHAGAVEVTGRMVHRGRSRAVALRLELVTSPRGRQVWTCTALVWA